MAVLSAGIDRYTAVVYTISMEDPGLQVVAAALHQTYTRRIPDAYQTHTRRYTTSMGKKPGMQRLTGYINNQPAKDGLTAANDSIKR